MMIINNKISMRRLLVQLLHLIFSFLYFKGKTYNFIKRVIDLILSFFALMVLSPLLLVVAIAVKLTSEGSVFYSAKRAGLRKKEICIYKFRTMVTNADRFSTITIGSDNRITKVGKLLRATKIDELPQLINIIKGEMSIVGPRPESLNIVKNFYNQSSEELLSVRPGLTCPGNLLYYVYHENLVPPANMHPEEFYAKHLLPPKLSADLHYVRHRCLSYDIKLIFETICIICSKWIGRTSRWEPDFEWQPRDDWKEPK